MAKYEGYFIKFMFFTLFYSLFKNIAIYSDSLHLRKTIQFGLPGLSWASLWQGLGWLVGSAGSLGMSLEPKMQPRLGDALVLGISGHVSGA